MIETILFSILSFVSLWGYFTLVGAFDFKKDPNSMEKQIAGRPARRTLGRKNDDLSKGIIDIFVGYALFCGAVYGLLDFKDVLFNWGLCFVGFLLISVSMFLFSPANRLIHAYINLGQIAVVHLVCSLSTFLLFATVLYKYNLTLINAGYLVMVIVGAMMCFLPKKNKKVQEVDDEGEF